MRQRGENSSKGSPDNLSQGSLRKSGTQIHKQLSGVSFMKLLTVKNDKDGEDTPAFYNETISEDLGSED